MTIWTWLLCLLAFLAVLTGGARPTPGRTLRGWSSETAHLKINYW